MTIAMRVTQITVTNVWDISYIFHKPEEIGGETHVKAVIAPTLMDAITAVTNLMSAETGFEIMGATRSKTMLPSGFIVVGAE
jgi:hypothetical protein